MQRSNPALGLFITASKPQVKAPSRNLTVGGEGKFFFLENDMNIILMDDPEHNRLPIDNHFLSEGISELDTFWPHLHG